jgi:hypothetical protein
VLYCSCWLSIVSRWGYVFSDLLAWRLYRWLLFGWMRLKRSKWTRSECLASNGTMKRVWRISMLPKTTPLSMWPRPFKANLQGSTESIYSSRSGPTRKYLMQERDIKSLFVRAVTMFKIYIVFKCWHWQPIPSKRENSLYLHWHFQGAYQSTAKLSRDWVSIMACHAAGSTKQPWRRTISPVLRFP